MYIKLAGILCALCACLINTTANAASFDFLSWANDLERGYSAYSRTVDGLTVTATGSSVNAGAQGDYFAYMDRGNAGLGVCKGLDSNFQCAPSSDDNLTSGEMLTLQFDQEVTIEQLSFRNEKHRPVFESTADFGIAIDNNIFSYYQLVPEFNTPLTGTMFSFVVDNYSGGQWNLEKEQLYLAGMNASPVPLPSSLLLLGSGLASLVSYRRRRNQI